MAAKHKLGDIIEVELADGDTYPATVTADGLEIDDEWAALDYLLASGMLEVEDLQEAPEELRETWINIYATTPPELIPSVKTIADAVEANLSLAGLMPADVRRAS